MKNKEEILHVPRHIAIIMDGNGRWASKRFLPRNIGHREGVKSVEKVIEYCIKYSVKILSLYAFSMENWNRPKKEVEALFSLIADFFDNSKNKFMRSGVKINVLGSRENLNQSLIEKIDDIEKVTSDNQNLTCNICFNYGGRQEIIHAVQDMVNRNVKICDDELSKSLYTRGIVDPDVIVRTSGEMRLSNFLLYQSAYAELYFTDCLWPDFNEKEFVKCLIEYSKRNRKFGKI